VAELWLLDSGIEIFTASMLVEERGEIVKCRGCGRRLVHVRIVRRVASQASVSI
jgi:hypothetical protein